MRIIASVLASFALMFSYAAPAEAVTVKTRQNCTAFTSQAGNHKLCVRAEYFGSLNGSDIVVRDVYVFITSCNREDFNSPIMKWGVVKSWAKGEPNTVSDRFENRDKCGIRYGGYRLLTPNANTGFASAKVRINKNNRFDETVYVKTRFRG